VPEVLLELLQAETKSSDMRISQVRFMEPPAPKVAIEGISSSIPAITRKAASVALDDFGD